MKSLELSALCFFVILGTGGATSHAQAAATAPTAKRPMTFADLMAMKRVSDPQVSPSGKWVMFSVTDVSLEKNTKTNHLWVVPLGPSGSGGTNYGDSSAAPQNDKPSETEASPTITIDDFAKVDLRVAKVLVAERIPKADKLLRLEVDLGYEKRQILAGIAQFYEPEKLVGRKVVIVANLAPRKMRGLESQGMVVAASVGPDGAPVLAGFLEDVEIGARLK